MCLFIRGVFLKNYASNYPISLFRKNDLLVSFVGLEIDTKNNDLNINGLKTEPYRTPYEQIFALYHSVDGLTLILKLDCSINTNIILLNQD